MCPGDVAIYVMRNGKFIRTDAAVRSSPTHANFVIVHVEFGDWSGFRTLPECEAQFAELEGYHKKDPRREYAVVER